MFKTIFTIELFLRDVSIWINFDQSHLFVDQSNLDHTEHKIRGLPRFESGERNGDVNILWVQMKIYFLYDPKGYSVLQMYTFKNQMWGVSIYCLLLFLAIWYLSAFFLKFDIYISLLSLYQIAFLFNLMFNETNER